MACTRLIYLQTCDILGAVAPYAARTITHLFMVSSRQRSYNRRRCENNLSFIVFIWNLAELHKVKRSKPNDLLETLMIDGGAVMNSLMVTYMWVQMGFPTGVCGVRSQHLHETK